MKLTEPSFIIQKIIIFYCESPILNNKTFKYIFFVVVSKSVRKDRVRGRQEPYLLVICRATAHTLGCPFGSK